MISIILMLTAEADAHYTATGDIPDTNCHVEILDTPAHTSLEFLTDIVNKQDLYYKQVENRIVKSHIKKIRRETDRKIILVLNQEECFGAR